MANRNWASGGKIFSMHASPVMMDCIINIGATGAVTSFSGAAVTSVVRNSIGSYTITLNPQTNFQKLFTALGSMQSASGGLSGILAVEIQNAPSTPLAVNATPSITIRTLDAAGALANPASGSSVNLMMICSNSSVIIPGE